MLVGDKAGFAGEEDEKEKEEKKEVMEGRGQNFCCDWLLLVRSNISSPTFSLKNFKSLTCLFVFSSEFNCFF